MKNAKQEKMQQLRRLLRSLEEVPVEVRRDYLLAAFITIPFIRRELAVKLLGENLPPEEVKLLRHFAGSEAEVRNIIPPVQSGADISDARMCKISFLAKNDSILLQMQKISMSMAMI